MNNKHKQMKFKNKLCRVIILGTNKSNLGLNYTLNTLKETHTASLNFIEAHHLYIISDDLINIGDYVIQTDLTDETLHLVRINDICEIANDIQSKVIASTDESLKLPLIESSFITNYVSKYNNGNIINDVLIKYEYRFPLNAMLNRKGKSWNVAINFNNEIIITD